MAKAAFKVGLGASYYKRPISSLAKLLLHTHTPLAQPQSYFRGLP